MSIVCFQGFLPCDGRTVISIGLEANADGPNQTNQTNHYFRGYRTCDEKALAANRDNCSIGITAAILTVGLGSECAVCFPRAFCQYVFLCWSVTVARATGRHRDTNRSDRQAQVYVLLSGVNCVSLLYFLFVRRPGSSSKPPACRCARSYIRSFGTTCTNTIL